MTTPIRQQPSSISVDNLEQDKSKVTSHDSAIVEKSLSTRDNFPKGLRGGGPCFDCLSCLCFCCILEEIACFECCRDC